MGGAGDGHEFSVETTLDEGSEWGALKGKKSKHQPLGYIWPEQGCSLPKNEEHRRQPTILGLLFHRIRAQLKNANTA